MKSRGLCACRHNYNYTLHTDICECYQYGSLQVVSGREVSANHVRSHFSHVTVKYAYTYQICKEPVGVSDIVSHI